MYNLSKSQIAVLLVMPPKYIINPDKVLMK